MHKLTKLIFVFIALFAATGAVQAKVRISINLSAQRMDVESSNGATYSWPISSARSGYVTPRGTYAAQSLQTMHRSKKYHNSPMPHSIFFHGGYAIHGTYETGSLGRPASHGCVRISPANAATLFSLVREEGATISITGSPPPSRPFARGEGGHARHYVSLHHLRHSTALSYAPTHHYEAVERIFGIISIH